MKFQKYIKSLLFTLFLMHNLNAQQRMSPKNFKIALVQMTVIGGDRKANLAHAKERIDEALSTGAEAIVTACPWCEKTLNEAISKSGSSLKILDIVELVEKAI